MALSIRLEEAEKERDRLKQALNHSDNINAQLRSDNAKLLEKISTSPLIVGTTSPTSNHNNNDRQRKQEEHRFKLEWIRSELVGDGLDNRASRNNDLSHQSGATTTTATTTSSICAIAALKTQVENLQANKESLVHMKNRLSSLIDDLITKTSSSDLKMELEDIRQKLEIIDLGKNQEDYIAEKVQAAAKIKRQSSNSIRQRLAIMNPFVAILSGEEDKEYGYKNREATL